MPRRPYDEENERYGDEAQRSRTGRDSWDDERRYRRREDDDRGMFERGADRVRSWFGDDEAERRRRMDMREGSWYGRGESGYRDRGERSGSFGSGWGARGGRVGEGDESWADRSAAEGRSTRSGRTFAQSHAREDDEWADRQLDDRRGWRSGFDASSREGGGLGRAPMSWSYTEVWLIPGPHTGRGPRGYQRSDDRIREDVCERLTQHGEIDASDIDVRVANGEVTLQGTVKNRNEKRRAEDAVESVSGVREVHNQLRVSSAGSTTFGSDERSPLGASTEKSRGADRTAGKTEPV